ncbi:MAG: hypothetical protein P1U63_02510 [Coxiellaceae bacterium]|nr:hypothetical protein [Coxiellaceae bacterium]
MTIQVHQIYYDTQQQPLLDPEFIPFDNRSNPKPELREYYVFKQVFDQEIFRQADMTGVFSWKYLQKSGVPGKKFLDFVKANPGYDVYFINPMPDELVYESVWQQGELCHPGIIALTEKILTGLGYEVNLADMKMGAKTTLYCNFWVGTQAFWQQYLPFLQQCDDYIKNQLSDSDRELLFSRADRQIDASYFPFIFERLFPTFLVLNPEIKARAYKYSPIDYWRLIGCDNSEAPWSRKMLKAIYSAKLNFSKRKY